MKSCTRCLEQKPFTSFYRQRVNSKDGYQSHCKACDNARVAARKKLNPEQTKAAQTTSDARKYTKNRHKILTRNKVWKIQNPDKLQAMHAKRRASVIKRTPSWLTVDDLWVIEQAYDIAQKRTQLFGFPWHVDHVIPLQGALVSGLHVPHNLQVVPAVDNLRKGNSFQTT